MSKFFEDLKAGLEDAIAHKEGKINLRTTTFNIPDAPDSYKKEEIKKIRDSIYCSQAIFAKMLNVSIKTIQSWESGKRVPTSSALRLIELIDKGIYRSDIYKKQ